MIRLSSWDAVANSFATRPRVPAAPGDRAYRRSRARPGLLDRALGARYRRGVRRARPGHLAGRGTRRTVQVIYRLIGGSFAACGLIAWRRRPDSRSGLLMTAAGEASSCRRSSASSTRPSRRPRRSWCRSWGAVLRGAAADAATGGGSVARRLAAGGRIRARAVDPAGRLAALPEQDGNLLAAFPNADIADAVDKGQRSLAGLACVAVAVVVAAAMESGFTPRGAAPCCRASPAAPRCCSSPRC